MFFHGQNVSIGQRSPMMRIFLFLLFLCIFFQCAMRYPSNPYTQVTLAILRLGDSGRFIRPIVCASYLPFRIRLCTLTAGVDSS